MSQSDTDKGKGRGKAERGRSRAGRDSGGAPRFGSKRMRYGSGDDSDPDPHLIIDTLLGCLRKDRTLLDRFVERLLFLPEIKSKTAEHVPNASTAEATEQIDPETMKCLNNSVQELTSAVNKLQSERVKFSDKCNDLEEKCDNLEQYFRRTNILISNVSIKNSATLETQVCNILNEYAHPPIEPTDIDRTHRIYRKASRNTSDRPPDIIVKFPSYRSKARILTQGPMEQLRADNEDREDKDKIFISEVLTNTRKGLFFSTRQMKRKRLIKDTFTRDGRIVVKLTDTQRWNITKQSDLEAMCAKYKLPVPKLQSTEGPQVALMETDPSSQPMSPSLLGSRTPFPPPEASAWSSTFTFKTANSDC